MINEDGKDQQVPAIHHHYHPAQRVHLRRPGCFDRRYRRQLPCGRPVVATYAMQAYQGYAYGLETIIAPATSMIILASSAIISFVLAIYLFSWDRQNSVRRGSPLLALISLLPFIVGVIFA